MTKIILASTSPRRREILAKAGIDFKVVKPSFDEDILNKSFSYERVENTALNKGLSVHREFDNHTIILSADTVVTFNNIILGKPKDYDDAIRILKKLSGQTHKVVTAVCLIDNETSEKIIKSETSEVSFNELSMDMIKNYVLNFKPYDKAGAYGIQELDKTFIKEIKGDYDNIVGLPLNLVIKMLKEINLL